MNADWQTIRAVFDEAAELEPALVDDFLDGACGDDAAMRARIEALLRASARADEMLAPAVVRPPRVEPIEKRWQGTRVGDYTIRRVIASGGMGTVFVAEQTRPRRLVALKMMRHDLTTPDAERRFRFEADVLGRFRHPGIAQIYEAGTWEEAGGGLLPYFAMEYVDGARDVVEHAAANALALTERLRLFQAVCAAIQYGHEQGVIHRDLKPSNILVDAAGRPKVIDFGVARARDPDQASTAGRTEPGYVVGTLQYMAPEQLLARREAVSTRSDVYALGAVLYQLACGRAPFDFSQTPLPEAARRLQDEDPAAPSSHARGLPSDLDWIVLKALARNPESRYASASELAADVGRFLDDLPVLAGPPSRRYRMRRFFRRHRLGVIAAGSILLALTAGLAVALSGLVRAKRALTREQAAVSRERDARLTAQTARERADAEADRARQEAASYHRIAGFLETLLRSANPRSARDGKPPTLLEVVERGAKSVGELEQDPIVRAHLMSTIGQTLKTLGALDRAEAVFADALKLCEESFGKEHHLTRGALNNLSTIYYDRGRYAEAAPLFARVLEAARTSDEVGARDRLTAQHNLANALRHLDRLEEADALLAETVAGARELGDEMVELRALMAKGAICRAMKRLHEAERGARETLERLSDVRGEDHPDTLTCAANLARVLRDMHRYDEAESLMRRALAGQARVLGADHIETLSTRTGLADLLFDRGRLAQAEALYRRTLEARRRVLGEDDRHTLITMHNLGCLLRKQGKLDEAADLLEECLELRRRSFGRDDRDTLVSGKTLATVYMDQKLLDDAEELLRESAGRAREVLPELDRDRIVLMATLAELYKQRKRWSESEPLLRELLPLRERTAGELAPETLQVLSDLGAALFFQGKLEQAEPVALVEYERRRRAQGESHPFVKTLRWNLAVLYKQLGRWAEAEKLAREALETAAADDPRRAAIEKLLASIEKLAGDR